MLDGVRVLHALAALSAEVPSVGQNLAASADAVVELLLCILVRDNGFLWLGLSAPPDTNIDGLA